MEGNERAWKEMKGTRRKMKDMKGHERYPAGHPVQNQVRLCETYDKPVIILLPQAGITCVQIQYKYKTNTIQIQYRCSTSTIQVQYKYDANKR